MVYILRGLDFEKFGVLPIPFFILSLLAFVQGTMVVYCFVFMLMDALTRHSRKMILGGEGGEVI